jgi:glycosyltransferase involved in cell wall biosynthesis
LLRADALAAPTRAFAESVASLYELPRRLAVIHNGRNALPAITLERRRVVLTAGRLWDEGKNLAALDRAAARLSAPVLAAGPTEGPNGARVWLGHLTRLGALDEHALAHHFASASVFASPARYEPFGLAVLEAAQSGMALVLSDRPGFRELWDGAAIFVDPEDTDAFVAALEQGLDAAEEWGARAQAASRAYSAARMATETVALHRSVLPALALAD